MLNTWRNGSVTWDGCGCAVGVVNWQFGGRERILIILPFYLIFYGLACGSLAYAGYGV
jgi:hypothetical protein